MNHSEDGELPDSEGELPDSSSDTELAPETTQPKESYTLFNTSSRAQNQSQLDVQNDGDYGIQDADMDPYSDYKPPARSENGKKTRNLSRDDTLGPNQGFKSPTKDSSSTEDAVSSPGVFGSKNWKNENQKKRGGKRDRKTSDDFLSELDQYNRIKDGGGAPKRSRKDRVHIKDKNSYHDFDNPSGGRRNTNRNHGSDFSDESSDDERSGQNFTYNIDDSDDSDNNDDDKKRNRPRIVDGRKKSPGRKRNRDRNSKIKFEDKRSKNRNKDRKTDKDDRGAKKQEVCKYYLAQTCLKAERCHYLHKQFPCKHFHFSNNCFRGEKCLFSHDLPTQQTQKILDRIRADHWVPDDSKEIAALEANEIVVVPKPPPGVPLLKTPPPSLLCEPMTGKYLDFSGPRELMPLGGDGFPEFISYDADINETLREECDNLLQTVIKGLKVAVEADIEDDTDIQVGQPFDDENANPEDVGWIFLEWRNKIEPLPEYRLEKPITENLKAAWDNNKENGNAEDLPRDADHQRSRWENEGNNEDGTMEREERRVSELDPRRRPNDDHFSERYGFKDPASSHDSPDPSRDYRRNYHGPDRDMERVPDHSRFDRDERYDQNFAPKFDRFDGPEMENDPFRPDMRYDSYNASPTQRDHFRSSHSPDDRLKHFSGNASPRRTERDDYGFNRRYQNRSRDRTPPGTYGSPPQNRWASDSHDELRDRAPRDNHLRDRPRTPPGTYGSPIRDIPPTRDQERHEIPDPRSKNWRGGRNTSSRQSQDRFDYPKHYDDDRNYETYPRANNDYDRYNSSEPQRNDADNFKAEYPSKYDYAHNQSSRDYSPSRDNSFDPRTNNDSNYANPVENPSGQPNYETGSKPIILRRESVSSNDPKTETAIIPDHPSLECRDPRSRELETSSDLPVPELIECVDFRVTFTLNGQPVPQKDDTLIDYEDKMKLPDLPSIPLPKLSVLTEVTDPRDPRRRNSSPNVTRSPVAMLSPSGTKKKISLSDYKSLKSKEPKVETVPTIPVYGSYGSGDL